MYAAVIRKAFLNRAGSKDLICGMNSFIFSFQYSVVMESTLNRRHG